MCLSNKNLKVGTRLNSMLNYMNLVNVDASYTELITCFIIRYENLELWLLHTGIITCYFLRL
jgi:hypothetical protein